MMPTVQFFDRTLPSYGVFGMIGFLVSIILLFMLSKIHDKSFSDSFYVYILGFLGLIAGAKILYIVIMLPDMIKDVYLLNSDKQLFFMKYIRSGMVFYGGFIGCLISALIALKYYNLNKWEFYPIIIPSYLCFAAFGRLGCFCTGCCYGKPTSSMFGVVFSNSLIAPHDVALIPTQIIEALFDILLLIFICFLSKKYNLKKYLLDIYVLAYAVFRFVLEFFRGDSKRGFILFLSVSQWISIVLLVCIFVRYILIKVDMRRNNRK